MTSMIYLAAPNDRNGNPRRAWFLLSAYGLPIECFDEGYAGSDAVPDQYKQQRLAAPRINVSVKEFKSWRDSVK